MENAAVSQGARILKFMVSFHLFFLGFGLLSLLLMVGNIIKLDWFAFGVMVAAIFINAFFGILWVGEVSKERPERKATESKIEGAFPIVSFVVPAYNEERNIVRCVDSLFQSAGGSRGPSEIIIVDDGSTDNTFEVALAAINSKQRELAHIRGRVVKHMTNLSRIEAIRTGVNKAMGEYIAIVDTNCDPAALAHPKLYRAESLRRMLNEKQVNLETEV